MSMMMPDMFAKIADATATQSGNWMRDGKYILAVKEHKYENKEFSGLTWVTEFIVVHSEPISGMLQIGGEPCAPGTPGATQVEPNTIGEKVSFVAVIGNRNTPNAAGNVKAYLLALSNTSEQVFNQHETEAKLAGQPSPFSVACSKLVGPEQVLRGALIAAQTVRSVNQGKANAANKGKILVKPTFMHIAHVPADIQVRRHCIEQGLPLPSWTPPKPTAPQPTASPSI